LKSTKVCLHCNIEKPIDEYYKYKTRSGDYSYRNVCKACKNMQDKNKDKNIMDTNKSIIIKNETEQEYKIIKPEKKEGEYKKMDIFNDDEIKILKSLISKHNDIMATINKKIVLEPAEKIKRVPKSLNIEMDIFNILQKHSKKANISISDIVNKLLRESISDIE